jgi:hypothetical protein
METVKLMKAAITTFVYAALIAGAWAQQTTTSHNPDGTSSKVSVSCDGTGDCSVWDSTADLSFKQRRQLLKDQQAYCKAHGISDKTVKGGSTRTMLGGRNINDECFSAWTSKEVNDLDAIAQKEHDQAEKDDAERAKAFDQKYGIKPATQPKDDSAPAQQQHACLDLAKNNPSITCK